MTAYQVLDAIADSINPIFGVVTLISPWLKRSQRGRIAILLNVLTLLAVMLAYALVALDRALALWSSVGLDFSTHAAVYLAIAALISTQGTRWFWFAVILGVAYAILMRIQDYHSWPDLLTTSIAMTAVLAVYGLVVRRISNITSVRQSSNAHPTGDEA